MAIYIEKKLDESPHLIKYCEFIRDLQRDYGNAAWRYYDEAFRRLFETYSAPWQVPIEELRDKSISQSVRIKPNYGGGQSQQGRGNQDSFRNQQPKTCFAFNRGEQCLQTQYNFLHACAICNKPSHTKIEWHRNKNRPDNQSDQNQIRTKSTKTETSTQTLAPTNSQSQ